jgi:predicted nucleic acid binding AN1-type Zn finger protein
VEANSTGGQGSQRAVAPSDDDDDDDVVQAHMCTRGTIKDKSETCARRVGIENIILVSSWLEFICAKSSGQIERIKPDVLTVSICTDQATGQAFVIA